MSEIINEMLEIAQDSGESALIGLVIGFLIFYLLYAVFMIVSYVFYNVGVHTIAKRRGILHPWLTWLPLGNLWILGNISDQYQRVAKNKNRRRGVLLLVLNIAVLLIYAVLFVCYTYMGIGFATTDQTLGIGFLVVFVIAFMVILPTVIIMAVFIYMSLYDLYQSCVPHRALTYLLLSIFLSVTLPFFVFSCRKKDLGMVPEEKPEEPAWQFPQ